MTSLPGSIRLVEGDARSFGAFTLIAKLGRGGMADVYLAARREKTSELCVVKRLQPDLTHDPEHLALFGDEARVAPLLKHPNVVRTWETGEADGAPFMAMEYLDGQGLDRVAPSVTALGERAALHVVMEVLDGLHYVHELPGADGQPLEIVHRDVSPHNVFVTYDGRVTLVDFGIAKSRARARHTTTGVVRGKLAYMAPEQALCDEVDRRVDVFAVGVMLFELLSGERFWGEQTDVQILKHMTFGEIPRIAERMPTLRPELAAVVDKALSVKSDERFATAQAFRAALAGVAEGTFRRVELGDAVAAFAQDERDAMKALVHAHLDRAFGTEEAGGVVAPAEEAAPLDEAASVGDVPPAEVPATTAPAAEADPPVSERRETRGAEVPVSVTPVPPARSRRGTWVVGLAAGLLALGALLGSRAFRGEETAETAPPSAAPPASSAEDDGTMGLRVEVRTPEAVATLDGARVDLPLVARFARDGRGHTLRVEAPGHATYSEVVVFDRDRELSLALDPVTTVPASAAAPVVTAPPAVGAPRPRVAPIRTTPTGKPLVDDRDPWGARPR